MTMSSEYVKPPRPILGWILTVLGLLVRVWAIPFMALGWLVGTLAMFFTFGFGFAWEVSDLAFVQRLRDGQRKPPSKKPQFDEDDEL